jgi:hypothetical protein
MCLSLTLFKQQLKSLATTINSTFEISAMIQLDVLA